MVSRRALIAARLGLTGVRRRRSMLVSRPKFFRRRARVRRFINRRRKLNKMVPLYMQSVGATMYISRRKYKVIDYYAKLMIRCHVHKKHHEVLKEPTTMNLEKHRKHKKLLTKNYKTLVRLTKEKMVLRDWYAHWQYWKEKDLAEKAEHVLKEGKKRHLHEHHEFHGMELMMKDFEENNPDLMEKE